MPMKMIKNLLALGLFSILSTGPSAMAMYNGVRVNPLDKQIIKSTVYLEIIGSDGSGGVCTGSLIRPHIILTAAHCVPENLASLHIGFYDGPNKFSVRSASSVLVHGGYDGTATQNDLALIYFPGSIPKGHAPIKILDRPQALLDSVFFVTPNTIAGYGVTKYGKGDSGTLRKTNVVFDGHHSDTISLFDLNENSSSACSGDSGGPAMIYDNGELKLWGVASFVDAPLCENHSYYTLASQHLDWITKSSNKLLSNAK